LPVLDSHLVHALQVFCVLQYLPKEIHCFNSVSSDDFVRHHERVRSLIADGHLTLGFDEQGVETSLALVFRLDVQVKPKSSSDQPVTKKVRVLQLYYEAPSTEDVPPGVFGASGVAASAWKQTASRDGSRVFQHGPNACGRAFPSSGQAPEDATSTEARQP
jgi:hypothetical protein